MPGQNTNAGNGANNNNPTPVSSGSSNAPTSAGTKNQLEQLNTMREALFSQDGWGYQHVNQDTNWEVSVSPEPQQKDSNQLGNAVSTSATQLWKPNINNGTELWEANLRNGGQPPVQIPVQKTPWGHTPSTNLGGTWGEDDDGAETSNVWARGPVEPSGVGSVNNQWGQQHNTNSNAPATSTWTDVREIVQRQNTLDLHRPPPNPTNPVPELQPRNVPGSGDPIRAILEQREPIRGDPRGISGRLNGTPEMWGQIPQQLQQHQTQNQMKVQNTGQWATAPEKPSAKPATVGSGWEEPSPPPQRRNVPNYDDGTSLWSQQNRWKQEESRGSHLLRSAGNPSNTNQTSNRSQKSDGGNMWGGRSNSTGGNNNSSVGGSQWEGENDNPTNSVASSSDWNKQTKLAANWDEPSSSVASAAVSSGNWEPKNAQQKVHGLLNMGFKKEEVERALIASNMNFDEALEFLSSTNWRRQEPEASVNYERSYGRVVGSTVPSQFPPAHVQQKYSGFGQQANAIVAANLNNVGGGTTAGGHTQEPTAQQLRMLVQQIQMAVQSGYLSSQILNQPLAPATLVLLNQLLTSIKHLQGAQANVQRGGNMNSMQLSLTIAKYKQQITSLQSQINAQQAIYIKQQQQIQQQQHQHVGNTEFIRNHHDALSALQGNFSELNLNKQTAYQTAPSNQQSRLNQWKLPVLESSDNADFSRAPGPTTKTASLSIQDGAWSSCRNLSDGWTDTTNDNENKDWPTTQASPAPAFTDLVPEFEPGKPWKGSQMKNIEDDPSITPGSVARSPLSINPMPKDAAEIFTTNQTNKNSPTDLPPLSLSSSTWSFNPSLSNQNFASWSDSSTVQQNSSTAAELWGTPLNKTSRGPPPGLGSSSKNVSGGLNKASSNGWIGSGRGAGNPGAVSWASTGNAGWNNTSSNWLLLKNLNNQIDGSTLCTLCKQHGPLLNFQLYLNQGIALCKYTTREEAQKAQMALNNCVLGNTTISVESPNESDVQNILQHFPLGNNGGNNGNNVPTNSGNGNNNRQVRNVGGPGAPTDAWSANSVWQTGGSTSSSLWTLEANSGGGAGGNANESTTPSNLKSLLPENLLELN